MYFRICRKILIKLLYFKSFKDKFPALNHLSVVYVIGEAYSISPKECKIDHDALSGLLQTNGINTIKSTLAPI